MSEIMLHNINLLMQKYFNKRYTNMAFNMFITNILLTLHVNTYISRYLQNVQQQKGMIDLEKKKTELLNKFSPLILLIINRSENTCSMLHDKIWWLPSSHLNHRAC